MADPLPDFPAMAGETQPSLQQLRSSADWATTFGPGETNLARRNAKAAQVEDYNVAAKRAAEDAFMRRVQTDKDALAFWKTSKDLEQKAAFHRDAMQNAANDFQRKQQKDLADNAARKAKVDLDFAHEMVATKDLNGFSSKMKAGLDAGVAPGTKAYQDLAIRTYLEHPNANKDVVKGAFSMARIKSDPDEVLAAWNELPEEQRANTTFKMNSDGTMGFTARNTTALQSAQTENMEARTSATNAGVQTSAARLELAKSREARMQSQFDRKLSDADAIKEDTSAFLADAARVHESHEQGTPEYRDAMADLVAAYPNANPAKTKAFLGMAGMGDSDQQQLRVRAQDFREKMALRSADRADVSLVDKEKSQAVRESLSASELALKERGQTTREAVADTNKAAKDAAVVAKQRTDLTKEIQAIEKVRQPWRGTTGIFTDKKGVERFGKAELAAEESPVATLELKADYQRYQNLKLKQVAMEAGVPLKKYNPESGRIE